MTEAALKDGRGLARLREFVAAQGGNPAVVDDYSFFPQHSVEKKLLAAETGYVSRIEARKIGMASQQTGAGRATKEDNIDLSAGIVLQKKVGDAVAAGDVLAVFYGNDEAKVDVAVRMAAEAFCISEEAVDAPQLIKEIIGL